MAKRRAKAMKAKGGGGARAKKPSNGATKRTASDLSDGERQRLVFAHRRRIKPLIKTVKDAGAELHKAYEVAKKDGIPKKDIELAILLETDEGAERVRADMERIIRLDRYVGSQIGVQLELFTKQDSSERNFEDGRRAALDDQPAKPPSQLSQKASNDWLEGHADGLKQNNLARSQGFGKLGEAAAGVVGKIGDAPPTHQVVQH